MGEGGAIVMLSGLGLLFAREKKSKCSCVSTGYERHSVGNCIARVIVYFNF